LLQQFYATIAQQIIQLTYTEQTSSTVGNISATLYPDSYIEFNYTTSATPYGLVITTEKQFDNTTTGTFTTPANTTHAEARVSSYSGAKWTSFTSINNVTVYNITAYGTDYSRIGDPASIQLPTFLIQQNNIIKLLNGIAPQNVSVGSVYNKIITTLVKNASGYSPIAAVAQGCIWDIQFDDNANITLPVPANYTGTAHCHYLSLQQDYDSNDAAQTAVFRLLQSLDLNNNGQVDIVLSERDIDIALSQLVGIPYTWSTEVQVRTWR
jgi:hypothetical protein